VFSNVLVLKNGKVLAAGKKSVTLATKILSQTFGAKVKLQLKAGRYAMNVLSKRSVVV
jgi:ABC-type hemin transport system ATPase subunit